MTPINRSAVARGILATIVLSLPLAILQRWLVSAGRIESGGVVNLMLFALIMAGAVIGGFAAGEAALDRHLQTGALGAGIGVLTIQVFGALFAALSGRENSNPITWIMMGTFAGLLGMGGAWIARRAAHLRSQLGNSATRRDP